MKTVAMFFGEVRSAKREKYRVDAESALANGNYFEARRLVGLYVKNVNRKNANAKSRQMNWKAKFLRQVDLAISFSKKGSANV